MVKLTDGSEISEKDLFRRIVLEELGISSPALCKFSQELIEAIPGYFWKEPASATGKHHPEYSLGEGGLARHSIMTYHWLKTLMVDCDQDLSEFAPGMVVAALFHDCCKRGLPENIDLEHTAFEHPLLAAKFVLDMAEKFVEKNKEFLETVIEDEDAFKRNIAVAVSCIETHMGKWTTSKHSEFVLPKPKTTVQYIVHLADYISSRKCTTFDARYFSKNADN